MVQPTPNPLFPSWFGLVGLVGWLVWLIGVTASTETTGCLCWLVGGLVGPTSNGGWSIGVGVVGGCLVGLVGCWWFNCRNHDAVGLVWLVGGWCSCLAGSCVVVVGCVCVVFVCVGRGLLAGCLVCWLVAALCVWWLVVVCVLRGGVLICCPLLALCCRSGLAGSLLVG